MEKKKVDRRVKYTKAMLRQSLLNLMRERPVSKISVKELCEKADINRGTFYAHYTDQYDLLRQIEDELTQEIMSSVQAEVEVGDITEMLTSIFRTIEGNHELCSVLFSEYGDKEFIRGMLNIVKAESIKGWHEALPDASESALELMYEFCANGSVAIIQYWLASGMRESPEKITEFIGRVSALGLRAVRQTWK